MDRLSFIFLLLWEIHYIQRTFVYALIRMKTANKTTLMVCVFAFIFQNVNSYLTTKFILFQTYSEFTFFTSLRWLIGFGMFIFGFVGNLWADEVLLNLRKNNDKGEDKSGEKQYYIPQGCLYELISCPNYACEILEWVGLCVMFPNKANLVFVFNTCFNLIPRAYMTHKWYNDKFGGKYPQKRKAIVPYLF